jgi:hypothetical protein
MNRSHLKICLFAVLPLLLSAIWLGPALAAVAPAISSLGQIRDAGLRAPTRIDLDAAGNLYVADPRAAVIAKFDIYGQKVATFSGFPVAGALAVTADGSRLYVSGEQAVAIIDGGSGLLLGHLGAGAGEFGHPFDLALDSHGYIFVADGAARTIRVYDPQGVFSYQFGSAGTGLGQFGNIAALAVHAGRGEVYVADNSYNASPVRNPRVHVFTLAGQYLRFMDGVNDFGSPSLYNFAGIAFDQSGRGYFLDEGKSRMVIIGLPATYLAAYSHSGYLVGKLQAPWDVTFDAGTSRLFVLCGDNRIEIFGIDGGSNPVRQNVAPGLPVPLNPIAGSIVASDRPVLTFGNAVDADGDPLHYNVQLLRDGQLVAEYLAVAEMPGQTTVQVAEALVENAQYSWVVQAFDGQAVSAWTAPQAFFVNAVQEPPSSPALLAPLNGEAVDGTVLLSWTAATDADPFDVVSYRLEVSSTPTFNQAELAETLSGTAILLADCAGYAKLQYDTIYFWRVSAVDQSGLTSAPADVGTFRYLPTVLQVTANVPGARVYLGGHYAFAGRFIGEVPVQLRDMAEGSYPLVLERAGLEPFVGQVMVGAGQRVSFHAELRPALVPQGGQAKVLTTSNGPVAVSGSAAPFLVDFDGDGTLDLLVGDAAGLLTFFKGEQGGGKIPGFAPGVVLGQFGPEAVPFLVDWNNDGRQDLLLGAGDGTVSLFLNVGGAPFAAGSGNYLQADGNPLDVKAMAAPTVIDIDEDGAKDLVVGAGDGKVWLFLNIGSDQEPQLAAPVLLAQVSGAAAPFFVDWNADGRRELLVSSDEGVVFFLRQQDGGYARSESPLAGEEWVHAIVQPKLIGGKLNQPSDTMERFRLVVCDADGGQGKDLLIGRDNGEIHLAFSDSRAMLPAFQPALLAKVGQIDGLAQAARPELLGAIDAIRAVVDSGDYREAGKRADRLLRQVTRGSELAVAVAELAKLLN